jgi:hypothetical protein
VHRDITPTHAHDVFWIFALWRAIHGGDPTLAEVAAAAIACLAQYLPAHEDSFGVEPLPAAPHAHEASDLEDDYSPDTIDSLPDLQCVRPPLALLCYDPREFSIHYYYFKSKGVFYRLDPAFACLPAAA